jgi:hypothetical protein
MSEEANGGFFGQLKNQILTGVGVAITAGSTLFLDVVKEKLGLVEEEPAQTEQVIQPAQPQEIIINMPEQKEQKKDTVVKKVYVKPKPKKTETEKRKDEGFDW